MNQQTITLQPEIIQFTSNNKQLIKITNRSAQTIPNCFFCLFNTSKYQFNPESFKLEPWESKIVTITLLNKVSDYKQKQFAYIKSKNFSKRITLVYNQNGGDDDKMRSPSSGVEDLYTLSSRDYRQTQKAAYDRVLAEKQAYIKRLERRLQQQEQTNRKDRSFTSQGKGKNIHLKQIQQLQLKITELNQSNQTINNENKDLKQKIKQLQSLLARTSKGQKSEQIDIQIQKILKRKQQTIQKLQQDIQFLQVQCEGLYSTISEKQQKIRNYEQRNNQLIGQLMKNSQNKLEQLQNRIQQQKRKSQKQVKGYKDKVKRLEEQLTQSQLSKKVINDLQHQIIKQQNQISRLQANLQNQKKPRKLSQEQKRKSLKIHLQNESLIQENNSLRQKVEGLQRSIDELRQQTIIYRSKVIDQESEKASRYLQVALQSCKNQNDILKKSKKQLQQSLAQENRGRKSYQLKTRQLQTQIRNLKQQINSLQSQKMQVQSQSRIIRDQSHQTIMKLRSENIELIQKIGFNKKKDPKIQKQLRESEIRLQKSQQQIKRIRLESDLALQKLRQVQDEKLKMSRKIQKYKKQTARQLKDISQNTLDELKRVKQENKKLHQKVVQLQKSLNQQKQQVNTHLRLDSTLQNLKNQTKTRYPASQSDRRTGIKNQRKQIEETLISYTRNQQLESLYSQLGQLRQFKNYINVELRKIKASLQNHEDIYISDDGKSLIFNCVNVFQSLRNRIAEQTNYRQRLIQSEKELSFMRGRLIQLQSIQKNMKIHDSTIGQKLSAIENNKLDGQRRLLQLVRQQMKSQYKKLHDSLSISQQKFELLKKKIYQQYRSRIIGILTQKQKIDNISKINKIQAALQRFVQGLANKSHKQAILSKQIKLKQQARKQAGNLKEKVGFLNQILQAKKGYCTREPVKVFGCGNEPQWHDNIRLQARLLTYQAENARLLEQISLYQSQNKQVEEQLKMYSDQLQSKQNQIIRLKKQVIQIQSANAKQLKKRQQDIDELQKRFFKKQQQAFQSQNKSYNQKQIAAMKQQIERKKQIIKSLKQKQKLLEQLIQSNRSSDSSGRNKIKKQTLQQIRMQQSLRQFKDSNRQLRNQNSKLKQQISAVRQQIQKKNAVIKRMRGDGQQSRIKAVSKDYQENQKLKTQIKQLKQQLKGTKTQYQKFKKKKEKQILQLQSESKKLRNQNLIQRRSLESVIRALCDNIKRLYSDLTIIARKKGLQINKQIDFQELLQQPGEIDSIKVYQSFEQLLKIIKT